MILFRRLASAALLCAVLPFASPHTVAQTPSKTTQTATASKAQAAAADKVDINSASADQLKTVPGIGDAYAKRIIDGRPYANKTQLTTKGVLPQGVYDKVKDKLIASQARK